MANPWDNDPLVGNPPTPSSSAAGSNPWDNDPLAGSAPAATPDDSGGVMDFLSQAYDSIKDMSVDDVTNYLKENGELPGGIGGAAAGALLGFLSPIPGGTIIGSILGGAVGSVVL